MVVVKRPFPPNILSPNRYELGMSLFITATLRSNKQITQNKNIGLDGREFIDDTLSLEIFSNHSLIFSVNLIPANGDSSEEQRTEKHERATNLPLTAAQ